MKRIQKSGILGCRTRNRTYTNMENLRIWEEDFFGNYNVIENKIDSYGNNIEEQYDKAYDLCLLGRLEEAYYIYVNLLAKCKEEKKWLYYYFTQINLRSISQMIKSIDSMTGGLQGIMYFGKKLELFEPKLLDDVGLLQAYNDLPAEIKRYSFLDRLSSNNYYSDDIIRLYEENYQIISDIAKSNVTILGAAAYDHSEILMKDAINFIYNNRLLFSVFSEHKNFVRTTMHTYLSGQNARMIIPSDENNHIDEEKFYLTYLDILLLIKNFKFKELQFLTKEVDLLKFTVIDEERDKFEKYVEYTIDFYMENFNGEIQGDRINMYILIKEEIKSMCYLGVFFVEKRAVLNKLLKFFMESIPEKELDYIERLSLLERIKSKGINIDNEIIDVIEGILVEKVLFCLKNSNPNLLGHWNSIIKIYSLWLNEKFPEFKSARLTEICSMEFNKQDKNFLVNLLPIIELDEIKEQL